MKLKEMIENARRTHDISTVLGTNKKLLVCPLPMHNHANNTPSFSIFWRDGVQYFACHGNCALRGDVIDLAGYLHVPGYDRHDGDMVRKALSYLDIRYEMSVPIPEKEEKLNGHEWTDFLPPGKEVIEYAHGRGLKPKTLEKFCIGQSGKFMTMPCFVNGMLRGIKMRNMTSDGARYMSLKGGRQGLFNHDSIMLTTETIFVVKAEIPCMLLDQLGFKACAPTGGEAGWMDEWKVALALANIVVIGDNDDPGRKLGQKRADLLGADLVFPAPEFKDIDDWILAEPEKAIAQLKRWSEC